jgi:formamidopyrimidine-DNA glycosylase
MEDLGGHAFEARVIPGGGSRPIDTIRRVEISRSEPLQMPELPEVETMVRGLRPAVVGRTIQGVEVLDPGMLQACTPRQLARLAAGRTVAEVGRRGKWVVFLLEPDDKLIVIQPRMTGGFFLAEPDRPQHIRLILHFGDGPGPRSVWFCDARRLGRIAGYKSPGAAEEAFSRSQGPDALVIGLDDLAGRIARTSRGIKPALMDQKVVAGIGNIYADEILHRSALHPERPANRLAPDDIARIHSAMREVLAEAIAAEGSSFDAGYRTVLGLEGGFLATNAVHRRKGGPCPRCGQAIVKERIAGLIGRPTYYCPSCQVKD